MDDTAPRHGVLRQAYGAAIQMEGMSKMTRKLKALGLALVAVFAVSAVMASGASANDLFTSDSVNEKTIITGNQTTKLKFTILGQPIECEVVHFEGTQSGDKVNDITLTPKFEKCTYNGSAAQTTLNNCKLTITSETNATGHNVVHIVDCPTAAPWEFHTIVGGATCTLTIIEQTPGEGVKFTNETTGPKKALIMHLTMKVKIHSASGVLACKALAGTSPVYTGTFTFTGKEDGGTNGQVNITFDTAPDA